MSVKSSPFTAGRILFSLTTPKGKTICSHGTTGQLGAGRDALPWRRRSAGFPGCARARMNRLQTVPAPMPVCPGKLSTSELLADLPRFTHQHPHVDPVCLGYLDSAGWPLWPAVGSRCRTHRLIPSLCLSCRAVRRWKPPAPYIATGSPTRRAPWVDPGPHRAGGGARDTLLPTAWLCSPDGFCTARNTPPTPVDCAG